MGVGVGVYTQWLCVSGVVQKFFLSVIESVESASDMLYLSFEGGSKKDLGMAGKAKCG